MNSLHCPNPRCTRTFSAAEVQRTGVVKCPGCGQEFRFRPPTPAPQPKLPQAPVAPPPVPKIISPPLAAAPQRPKAPKAAAPKPVAPKPIAPKPPPPKVVAPPVAPKISPPPPPAPRPSPAPAPNEEKLVRVRGSRGSQHTALKFAVVGVVVIFTGAALYLLRGALPRDPTPTDPAALPPPVANVAGTIYKVSNLAGFDEKALTVNVDPKEWSTSDAKTLKETLEARAAFKAVDGSGPWFAVAVQDLGLRRPRDKEMLRGAVDRLTKLFGDMLQVDSNRVQPAQLGGLPAARCAFEGRIADVWGGECYMIFHKGFAYWVFVAAKGADGSQAREAAQALAKRLDDQKAFAFTTERRDWVEQSPYQMMGAAELAFSVQATDTWSKHDPKIEDDAGIIFLAGNYQTLQGTKDDKSPAKNATMLGVALAKRDDVREAFSQVRLHFEKKKQEEDKEYRFVPIEKGVNLDGDVETVGDLKGCVGEMRLVRGDDPKQTRYVLVAAFNDGSKTFGLRFECAWDVRQAWQNEFREMLKSVRLGAK